MNESRLSFLVPCPSHGAVYGWPFQKLDASFFITNILFLWVNQEKSQKRKRAFTRTQIKICSDQGRFGIWITQARGYTKFFFLKSEINCLDLTPERKWWSEINNVVMTRSLTRYLRDASVCLKIKRLKSKLYLRHGIWSTLRIDGGPDNNVGRGEVRWQNRAGDCQLQADGIENHRIGWPVRHVRI